METDQIDMLKRSNKKWRTTCIILGLVALVSVVYANVQKAVADENLQIAEVQLKRAEEEKMKARAAAEEAFRQAKVAQEISAKLKELEEKKNTKK